MAGFGTELQAGEVEGVISYVTARAKSLQQRSFVIKMDELKPLMIGAKDESEVLNRIRWYMEDPLKIAGIVSSFQGDGYRFTLNDDIDITPTGSPQEVLKPLEAKQFENHPAVVKEEWTTDFIPPYWYSSFFNQIRKGRYGALIGTHGCGKSRSAVEMMKQLGIFYLRIAMGEVRDPVDLIGTKELIEKNGVTVTHFVGGMMTEAIINGWGLILDEIDSVHPSVALVFNKLLEEGSTVTIHTEDGTEVIPKHPMFRVITTSNTWGYGDDAGRYAGTRQQNRSTWDRLRPKQDCTCDPAIEKQLIKPYIPEGVLDALYGQSGMVGQDEKGVIYQIREGIADKENILDDEVSFRAILYFAQEFRELGWHKSMWYFLNEFEPDNRAIIETIITDKLGKEAVPSQNDHSPDQPNYIPTMIQEIAKFGLTT